MIRRTVLGGFAGAFLASAAMVAPVAAAASGAGDFVQSLGDRVIEMLRDQSTTPEAREAEVRSLLEEGFDMAFIGRVILGRYWRRASADQRRDYQILFREYLVRIYSGQFNDYSGETFSVIRVLDGGDGDKIVRSRITRPSGPPVRIDWRVRAADSSRKIVDVSVEGVSLLTTKRSEFAAVVARNGVAGLISKLRSLTGK